MRKENKTGNEETAIVNKLLIHGDADKSHLGFFVTYREATGTAHAN